MAETAASVPAKVLVIDDETTVCMAVRDLLELSGHRAHYVASAEEGLEYLSAHPDTDVVLLDIMLGAGLNGLEAITAIRDEYKYVQVIMFTSQDSIEAGVEAMRRGAFDYVIKPFDEEDCLKKVAAAAEKKRLERLNDLYLGILVHDLKNPVQVISGAAELLDSLVAGQGGDKGRKYIKVLRSGLHQIGMMIENILSITKFEAGALVPSVAPHVPEDLVRSAVEPLRGDAESSQRTLEIRADSESGGPVHTDGDMVARVVLNIVSNALRFTPTGGRIEISVARTGDDRVKVSVGNTGSFVKEDEREAIFNKFSSVQLRTRGGGARNFGLGLTYSRMAVEALGGEIWVDGDRDEPSTVFHFTILDREEAG